MGGSRRAKETYIRPEQKWEFITLQDFKSSGCVEPFAYAYLWVSLAISVAVYGVDTFTAVNLLAFSKFTSIQPAISLDVSKWIFSVCIILSWVNLGYEHWRAYRVIRRGAVAESYLDSLAVRIQCIRFGKSGQGWRRFLVFAELTKSKKGAEYVALFTYFAFQTWIRVIFCSGPRQVVNALTLYAVYQAHLNPNDTDAATSIFKFFSNIEVLAQEDYRQALILAGMLFTLVIWVFAVLSMILAILFYLFFLWHYIPNSDGGLSAYCERKINERLNKIVSAKVQKALEDEERKRLKAEQKAAKKGDKPITRPQPTLPSMFEGQNDDKLPEMPMINRNDTMATLPRYTSRPGTPASQQPRLPDLELSNLDQKRPFPSRTGTSASNMSNISYASNAPLLGAASEMGYGRSESPVPSIPPFDQYGFPVMQRSTTGGSNISQWERSAPQQPRHGPLSRKMTQDSFASGMNPHLRNQDSYPAGLSRQMTQDSFPIDRTSPFPRNQDGYPAGPSRQMTQDSFVNGRTSPSSRHQDSYPAGPSEQISHDSIIGGSTDPKSLAHDSYPAGLSQQTPQDPVSPSSRNLMSHDQENFPLGPSIQDWYTSGSKGVPSGDQGEYPPPSRQMTQESNASGHGPSTLDEDEFPRGISRKMTQESYTPSSRGPLARQMTGDEFATSPISNGDYGRNSPAPQPSSPESYGRPLHGSNGSLERRPPLGEMGPSGRASPAPSSFTGSQSGRGTPGPGLRSNMNTSDPSPSSRYGPPPRSTSAGIGPGAPFQRQPPQRNMTEPVSYRAPTDDSLNAPPLRHGTPQNQRPGYNQQYMGYDGSRDDVGARRGPPSRGYPQHEPPSGYRR